MWSFPLIGSIWNLREQKAELTVTKPFWNQYPLSVNDHGSPNQIHVSQGENEIGCESCCLCFEKVPDSKKWCYFWNFPRKIMTLSYIQNSLELTCEIWAKMLVRISWRLLMRMLLKCSNLWSYNSQVIVLAHYQTWWVIWRLFVVAISSWEVRSVSQELMHVFMHLNCFFLP